MDYAEQQPLRALYKPANGWVGELREEVKEEAVEVEEPERKKPSKIKAVVFWLFWSVISIPVLTVKGLLEGVSAWWGCLGCLVEELTSKGD